MNSFSGISVCFVLPIKYLRKGLVDSQFWRFKVQDWAAPLFWPLVRLVDVYIFGGETGAK
jgi:hypothetical protein